MDEIVAWWKTGSPTGAKRPNVMAGRLLQFDDPDYRAVTEAMHILERTGLLMRGLWPNTDWGFEVALTRLGWHALQTNTVRQHLGLGDAPSAN
jgi:hypothetical protein